MKYQNKNETFFEKPSRVNSYWAGFIAADGCVYRNTLKITLSKKDKAHLEALSSQLNEDYRVKEYKRSGGYANNSYSVMNCTSKKMIGDLNENFNITPRKTFTLQFPKHLTVSNKKAFICGYIDGDGHIGLRKGHGGKIQMSICGNEEFLTGLICFLQKDGGIDIKNNIYPSRNIFVFACSGRVALDVLGFLYGEDLPLLVRKWDTYIKHREHKFGQYLVWSKQELELIKKLYPTKSTREIWELHFREKRSFASVEKVISSRLGLRKFPPQKKWEPEEDKLLCDLRSSAKLSVKEIHQKYFPYRTLSSVKNRSKRYSKKRGEDV